MVETDGREESRRPKPSQSGASVLKRAMAASPETVSPQVARSLQATENVWRRMGVEHGLLTSSQVAALLGANPSNRKLASRRRAARQLAGVVRGNAVLYPGFQFDRTHARIFPVMEELIQLADANDWREEDLLLWLCSPTTTFDTNDRPIDHFDQPEAVAAAAKDQFEAEW